VRGFLPHRRLAAASLILAVITGCGGEGGSLPSFGSPSFDSPSFDPEKRAPLVRPDTQGNMLLHRFAAGDTVESFGSSSGHFLVHFTRSGINAVPAKDADASGIPDFVEEVASVYDDVLARYQVDLGFRPPKGDADLADNGGDGRFDVYLVDFVSGADGNYVNDTCGPENPEICAGYMVQENDFKGYFYPSTLVANRILGSHELFHAIQAAYDDDQGSIINEGTAVWATEKFDPSLDDFEGFVKGYLDFPDRSLDVPQPGPIDAFSYGSALFFEFLEERYGKGTIRDLWERCENGANGAADPGWFGALDGLLGARAKTTFSAAFTEFATYNLFTGPRADPPRGYASGAGYPLVKMASVTAPHAEAKLRSFYASTQYYEAKPEGRAAMTAALVSADPAERDGLTLLLAARRGAAYDRVTALADVTAGTQTVATSGADALVVAVVNGRKSGNSRRPGLCIGTTEEVATCRDGILGASSGSGGGGGTMSGSATASTSGMSAGGGEPAVQGPICGFRQGAAPPSRGALVGMCGVALAFLRARWRRGTRSDKRAATGRQVPTRGGLVLTPARRPA
jgi:hypothetical protein